MKTARRGGPQTLAVTNRDGHAIGLDIGGTAVRAAVLAPRSFERHRLVGLHTVGRVGLPRGAVVGGTVREPALVTHALKTLWQQHRIDCRNVILGITNQQVAVREVELPDLPAAERVAALPFQARDVIALPVERAILDFIQTGPPDPDARTVPGLLVAAPHEPVSVAVRAVEQAGLRVTRVDLAAFGALRAVAAGVAVGAVVDLGAHMTSIAIHNQGVPQLVRTVARGGDEITSQLASRLALDGDAAELAKRTVGLGDADADVSATVREALRPLLAELRSSVRLFEQTHPEALVERVTLTGGGAALPGLIGAVADDLDIATELGSATRHVSGHRAGRAGKQGAVAAGVVDPTGAASAVCVGLALGAAA